MNSTVISHLLETEANVDEYLISEWRYLMSRDEGECIGGMGYDISDRDHTGFVTHPHNLVYSPTRVIMSIEAAIEIVESAMRIKTL